MRKNLYLLIFLIGTLIIGIPQFRILIKEMETATQVETYQERVRSYPDEDLQMITRQLETVNSVTQEEVIYEEGIREIRDPFTQDVAADDIGVADELFTDNFLGYLSIPKIGEQLPIYNGATSYHLSMGAATVTGTSLPVGGESTHAVISAHRGYAGANYFRHIDLLVPGDEIIVTILNNVLTYEVTGTQIVEANDASGIMVVPEQDLLSLLSCHPFMVNDKRILVHAKRIPTTQTALSTMNPTDLGEELPLEESTEIVTETTVRNQTETEVTTTEIISHTNEGSDSMMNIIMRFKETSVSPVVRRNLFINRILVLGCTIAIAGTLVLLIKNNIKL